MPRFAALLGWTLWLLTPALAQSLPSNEEGAAYLSQSWSWRDYGANNQNWAVVHGPRGTVFVANAEGVLEYDGATWVLHSLPETERTLVRSLAYGPGDQLYVGGVGEIGVMAPDARGFLQYQSLRRYLPEEKRAFADVWTTHVVDRGVVFQTADWMALWDGRRMRLWEAETRFRTSFLVGGAVYVWEEGLGLKTFQDNRLAMISGGRGFAHRKVDALLPHDRGLMAVVRDEGLVLIRPDGTEAPIEGAGSAYLREYRPYSAVPVVNRYARGGTLYAVATFGGGVAVVTPSGDLLRVYREDAGLSAEEMPVGLDTDDQGGLWVAHLNGVARLDLFSRSTWFDDRNGLLGSVYAVADHEGQRYVGTSNGLFRLIPGRLGRSGSDGPGYARFEQVAPVVGQTWDLLSTPQGLLVGTNDQVYVVRGEAVSGLRATGAFAFMPADDLTGEVYVGQKDGVGRLAFEGGRWVERGRVEGVEGETRALVKHPGGGLWASPLNGALTYISERSAVRTFGPDDGLESSAGLLLPVRGEIWMATREGVRALTIESGGRLGLAPVPEMAGVRGVYSLHADGEAVWTSDGDALRQITTGRFAGAGERFHLSGVKVLDLHRGADGVVWVGTSDGLLRYDPRVAEGERAVPVSIRLIATRDREPLYGGHLAGRSEPLEIPFDGSRAVRLEAAAAYFGGQGAAEYQFFLEGFDEGWQSWSPERVATFTNLWPGTYTLRVRARTPQGQVSDEAAVTFRIVPPWYLAWWAYVLYAVGAAALLWAATTWRLRGQRMKLAEQRARSTRLHRLSARLEKANAGLRQADRLKDDLLANTSHELRTPLTGILGFSEMLLESVQGDDRDLAEGIQRGGQRLLTTVNGLLDMFKLQSGTMVVRPEAVDAARLIRETVGLLQPLAASQGTDLCVSPEGLTLPATLDPALLDRVVSNVVSNAVKFTPRGRVVVLVDGDDQCVHVTVRDTGVGVAAEDVGRIFEPFEQASTGFARTHEGTGLGLAIVRRVLDLVGGHVSIESEVGVGTTVRIAFPRTWAAADVPAGEGPYISRPALEGAHVLSIGLDGHAEEALGRWISRHGTVCAVPTLGRGLREARKAVFDVVLVVASDAATEGRQTRVVRAVAGYQRVPVVRVAAHDLDADDLRGRGFDHQVRLPLDAVAVIDVLEVALTRVEEGYSVPVLA